MTKQSRSSSSRLQASCAVDHQLDAGQRSIRKRRSKENSDVLISAVISSYLLTHLHQVLQRAEYGAVQEGRESRAANFAQLRKVLCMDARSMEDASAVGSRELEVDPSYEPQNESNAA